MSRKSKHKRDQKKKKSSSNGEVTTPMSPEKYMKNFERLFHPDKFTTPKGLTDDLLSFCKKISPSAPMFLKIVPEDWCRQGCCDINVKKYVELHNGNILCGYKIWYHQPYLIEAERHAIWQNNSEYKDITFNSDGEETVLFLPDVPEKQGALRDNKMKIRWGKDIKTRRVIQQRESMEKRNPIPHMSNEESWNTMLTYKDWKEGKRMPNLVAKSVPKVFIR